MKLSTAIAGENGFLAHLAASGKSRATIQGYGSDLMLFVSWLHGRGGHGADSVTAFNRENIELYFASLAREERVGQNTRKRKLAAFRKFGKWGARAGIWSSDPTAGLESIPKKRTLPRPLTRDEVRRILALLLPPKERALRALFLYTGLRVSAIAGLLVGHVGERELRYTAKGGRVKSVPLASAAAAELHAYIRDYTDGKPSSFVFLTARGRPYLGAYGRKALGKIVRRWGRLAGVSGLTPHRFRHTVATEMLRNEGNLRVVQEFLGHEDISSTAIYTAVVQSQLEAAAERLAW